MKAGGIPITIPIRNAMHTPVISFLKLFKSMLLFFVTVASVMPRIGDIKGSRTMAATTVTADPVSNPTPLITLARNVYKIKSKVKCKRLSILSYISSAGIRSCNLVTVREYYTMNIKHDDVVKVPISLLGDGS